MEIGLVGLPNAGKSTIFNALTNADAQIAEYAFTTIKPNIGVVAVPDKRLDKLAALFKPEKVVPAIMRFVDIAGLVKGASKGEGLGNKFLGHIRRVDAVAQVVRCFNDGVESLQNQTNPTDDIEIINTELALADLETCEKRFKRLEKMKKSGDKEVIRLAGQLEELMQILSSGKLANSYSKISDFKDLNLLTAKPRIYIANISEDKLRAGDLSEADIVKLYAAKNNCDVVIVSAKVEAELTELGGGDAQEFRDELGVSETSLNKLICVSYHTLGLMSFFTVGPKECRAWTIKQKSTAVEAAARIHTDFARGFIRAEVISWSQLLEDGSEAVARNKGHLGSEGKEYIVQDGDVINFKFNV